MELENIGAIMLGSLVKEAARTNINFFLELQGLIHRFEHKDLGDGRYFETWKNQKINRNGGDIIGVYDSTEGRVAIIKKESFGGTIISLDNTQDFESYKDDFEADNHYDHGEWM